MVGDYKRITLKSTICTNCIFCTNSKAFFQFQKQYTLKSVQSSEVISNKTLKVLLGDFLMFLLSLGIQCKLWCNDAIIVKCFFLNNILQWHRGILLIYVTFALPILWYFSQVRTFYNLHCLCVFLLQES